MDDCILREVAVFQIFNKIWTKTDEDGYIWVLRRDVIHALDDIPAADVRPVVRGKWIKYAPHNSDMMTCSECEKYWILDGDQYEFNFCPNCGADMREVKVDGN